MTSLRVRIADGLVDAVRAAGSGIEIVDVACGASSAARVAMRVPDTPYETVAAALDGDPSVTTWRHISGDGGDVYRVDPAGETGLLSAYRVLADVDGVPLGAVGDANGWRFRALFPSRTAATDFVSECDRAGVELTIKSVHAGRTTPADDGSALTPTQAETLRAALDAGYYDVPRRATLSDLACTLEVSEQAVSERLRRGLRSVLRETVDGGRSWDHPP